MDSNTLERFMKYVEKTDTCWNWTGCKTKSGYGLFNMKKHTYTAHRAILEHHLKRPLAEGMVVAHTPIICHNSSCVNPEHLRECTQSENHQDKKIDGTDSAGIKHGQSKLTEEQVIAIKQDNRPLSEIALTYGVVKSCICNIKKGKRWKHI